VTKIKIIAVGIRRNKIKIGIIATKNTKLNFAPKPNPKRTVQNNRNGIQLENMTVSKNLSAIIKLILRGEPNILSKSCEKKNIFRQTTTLDTKRSAPPKEKTAEINSSGGRIALGSRRYNSVVPRHEHKKSPNRINDKLVNTA